MGSIYSGYVMLLAAVPAIGVLVGFRSITFAITNYVITLVMTYVIALVVDVLAPKFGGESDFVAALKLSAYSYTAAFIGGIAHILGAHRRTAGDRRDDLRVLHVLPRRAGAEEVRAGQGGAVHRSSSSSSASPSA